MEGQLFTRPLPPSTPQRPELQPNLNQMERPEGRAEVCQMNIQGGTPRHFIYDLSTAVLPLSPPRPSMDTFDM